MKHTVSPLILRTSAALLASALGMALPLESAHACASCGCTLSSDWETLGYGNGSGFKLDVRYDYINQNHLRSGTKAISSTAASQVVNNGEPQEVEGYTKNNYTTVSLDYSPNADWGVNLQLPYIVRNHSTLGTASDGITAGPDGGQYESRTASLGDVKIVGRYQGFTPDRKLGVVFGVKLPTGSHTQTGESTDPGAPGPVDIDRGLQPGTGTTDLILGAFYTDLLGNDWDYLVQGLVQDAINNVDDYKPGRGFNLNLGVRYKALGALVPQVQINVRHALRDVSTTQDTVSTGGTLVYLSPGVSAPINAQASVYGFVQVPLYQKLNGVQLTPRYTATVGLRYAF